MEMLEKETRVDSEAAIPASCQPPFTVKKPVLLWCSAQPLTEEVRRSHTCQSDPPVAERSIMFGTPNVAL